MKILKPEVLPKINQWTDAELAAYEQLEVDLYNKYLDIRVSVRQFSLELSAFMKESFGMFPEKKRSR